MNLLVEMFELSSGVAQPELPFEPNSEAEKVREEQAAIKEDGSRVFMPNERAPRDEKLQLAHERKSQRDKNHECDKKGISKHTSSDLGALEKMERQLGGLSKRSHFA